MPNLERLREARALLANVPRETVNLDVFACGALSCALGHLARQSFCGMARMTTKDGVACIEYEEVRCLPLQYASLGVAVFGLDYKDSRSLFGPRWTNEGDDHIIYDRAVLMDRFNKLFIQLERE